MFYSQKKSPVHTIRWTIEESLSDRHGNKERRLYVAVNGETHTYLATYLRGKEEPGVDLYGTWERKGTVSILKG